MLTLSLLAGQSLVIGQAGPETAVSTRAELDEARVERAPTVFVGRVLGPDGAPVEGAMVVSSAGGRALTDARGDYRLEAEVPLGASRAQIMASAQTAAGSLLASASVATSGATRRRA